MNKAIKAFGLDLCIKQVIQCINEHPDKVLISVGSGNGKFEHKIIDQYPNVKIICVDPDPESYSKLPILLYPEFSTTDDLVQKFPELVGNCLLLLNWCYPNDSTYDYDAIMKLKPIAFVSIYESLGDVTNGAAGGEMFYNFLHDENNGYTLVHRVKGNNCGLLIEQYTQTSINKVETTVDNVNVDSKYIMKDNQCVIM